MQVAHAQSIYGGLDAVRVLELAFIDRCATQVSRLVMISDRFQHERADVVSTLHQPIVKKLAFLFS
jgi:hypothetical protein